MLFRRQRRRRPAGIMAIFSIMQIRCPATACIRSVGVVRRGSARGPADFDVGDLAVLPVSAGRWAAEVELGVHILEPVVRGLEVGDDLGAGDA